MKKKPKTYYATGTALSHSIAEARKSARYLRTKHDVFDLVKALENIARGAKTAFDSPIFPDCEMIATNLAAKAMLLAAYCHDQRGPR